MRDHLLLHLIILLWSLTAILGKLISMPVADMVIWRTGISTVGFFIIALVLKKPLRIAPSMALKLLGGGAILSLHWLLFFQSARVSTASVSLAAMPTLMIWCSLLEPLIDRSRRLRPGELIVGSIIVCAVWLIYSVEYRYAWGFTLSLVGVILAALFSVVNKRWAQGAHFATLCTWQFAGATVGLWLFLPIMQQQWLPQLPSWEDLGWLLIFALICTVATYGALLHLLQRVSIFTVNVVYNLEPIYGIGLAALVFGTAEHMRPGFYWGAVLIVGSVIALPLLRRWVGDDGKNQST